MSEFLSRRPRIGAIVLLLLGTAGEMRAAPPDGLPPKDQSPSIAELVRKLKDDEYGTRYQAAEALEKLGAGAEPALPALIDALGDDGAFLGSNADFVSSKAERTLLRIGPPSVPALAAASKGHSNPRVRRQTFWVLGLMGREAQAAIPVLQAALRSKMDRVAAVQTLRQIDPEGAFYLPTLIPGTKQPIPTLIDSLRHPDASQQILAAQALSEIGPTAKQAIPALLELLKHEDYSVRSAGANALGFMGREAEPAVKPLLRALQDDNWDVRSRSASALSRIAPRNREVALALVRLLTDSHVRSAAAKALGQMGPGAEAAVGALSESLQDPAAGDAAAAALGEIGPAARAAVPALIRAMQHPNSLRYEATTALGRIGLDAQAAIPALLKALEDNGDLGPPEAVESLAQIGSAAVPALTAALREDQPLVRMRAAEALGASARRASRPCRR